MSKIETNKIVKQYAQALKRAHYPFKAIYLFGSHARGVAHQWSDIDVAVVSDKLKHHYDKNRFLLWDSRLQTLPMMLIPWPTKSAVQAYE